MARRHAASAASAVARALLDLAAARPSRLAAPRRADRPALARRAHALASSPRDDDDDARSSPPDAGGSPPGLRPGPVAAHARLVRSGERIGGDARQDAALRHLQRLRDELGAAFDDDDADDEGAAAASRRASIMSSTSTSFRRRPPSPPPRGVYLHGGVGRGKTMLMDTFFATLPPRVAASARRVHFHEFMAETHGALHALAERHRRGESGGGGGARASAASAADPLASVAASLVARSPLVCFDEVELSDVADALVFKRLFEKAFDYGGVLVATSNCAPDQLYAGGINRDRFAPFAEVLRERCEIVSLDEEGAGVSETANRAATHLKASTGIRTDPEPPERDVSASAAAGVDYRAARYEKSIASSRGEGGAARLPASRAKEGPAGGGPVDHTPEGGFGFDDDWQQMMRGPLVEEEVPLTGGRTVPARVGRVSSGEATRRLKTFASFRFAALCGAEGRLSAGDYALLATAFSAVRIEGAPGVPRFTLANEDEARRFINLVDVLYEKRRLLVADLAAAPGALFDEGAGGNVPPGGGAGGGGGSSRAASSSAHRLGSFACAAAGESAGDDSVESETRAAVRAAGAMMAGGASTRVGAGGGSSGRHSTTVGAMEWSATGRRGAALADLQGVNFTFRAARRCASRLMEMAGEEYEERWRAEER